ncbi:MAG: hypothetical protein HC902_01125, partial [Calothrix sp. SM1_5_4]|nr:hypothetical protein [Calothrix sp. SM1_5_4]
MKRQIHYTSAKLDQSMLDYMLRLNFNSTDVCSCHLNGKTINTASLSASEVNLLDIRSGCDTSTTDNILVSTSPIDGAEKASAIQSATFSLWQELPI